MKKIRESTFHTENIFLKDISKIGIIFKDSPNLKN